MQSIEDERQIIALINRYATGLDTADWVLLRSCWADEVEVDYGTGETWSSADALNAFMDNKRRVRMIASKRGASNRSLTDRQTPTSGALGQ